MEGFGLKGRMRLNVLLGYFFEEDSVIDCAFNNAGAHHG